jgi:single-strand DNA-binding protein
LARGVLMGAGMSEGLNHVTLFGNLGADPELRQTAKGPVLKMRLATNYSWFDEEKQQREERVEWHDVAMFGRRAEALSKILTKGSRVLIQGHLSTSSWEKDGQKRYRTEVIADDVKLGGGGRPSNGAFARAPAAPVATADLPF